MPLSQALLLQLLPEIWHRMDHAVAGALPHIQKHAVLPDAPHNLLDPEAGQVARAKLVQLYLTCRPHVADLSFRLSDIINVIF